MKNEIVLFTDGDVNIEVQINPEQETVWLTQKQMEVLFDSGGGRADAGILHRLAFGLVGQFASGGFHRRQQARFRVKGARPGLFLFRAASFDGQLVALYDVGKEGHVLLFLLDRFIQDGPPAIYLLCYHLSDSSIVSNYHIHLGS